MDCSYFTVFTFLLTLCFVAVFSQSRQDLNGKCRIVSECRPIGYYCAKNATCQCRTGYVADENWTKCLGYVGSKCTYDYHCIEGAYCTGVEGREQCRCREEDSFVLAEDGQTCTNSSTGQFVRKNNFLIILTLISLYLYLNT